LLPHRINGYATYFAAALLGAAALAAIPDAGADASKGPGHYAVAAENEASARAAMSVLAHGGTAVDAAIAASAMLGLTAAVSSGLGGGGFALVYEASSKSFTFLDYREMSPKRYDAEARASNANGAAVGVPGEPAGLVELHRRWGSKSLSEDLAPAADAAEHGFIVTKHMAELLRYRSGYLKSAAFAAIFAPHGAPAEAEQRIANPALAATLRRLGAEGARPFYQGPIARELVDVARAAGSVLETSDFAEYRVATRDPLRARWGDYDVITAPPPSAGGLLLLETLGLYSASEIAKWGWQSADYTHMLAEGMRGAIADRIRGVGDPAFVTDRTAEFMAPKRLAARRAHIDFDRTHAPNLFDFDEHGTTHLVVADAKGNVVSLTTTVNSPFGSGVVAPQSGILLNDELSDFTEPRIAAVFGAAPDPNRARGGARPVSSMAPTIVMQNGTPVLAIGGSGGLRIPVNVTQALLCRLVFDKAPQACLEAPRFFPPPVGPTLSYNADQAPASAVSLDLAEKGEQVRISSGPDGTAVQMIAFERSSTGVTLRAAADARKGGVGLVE
jgi:gamma-glutamyltranspeptidase/glutathione hydrolase